MIFSILFSLIQTCFLGYGPDENGDCVACESYGCWECDDSYKKCTDCFGSSIDTNKDSVTYGKCTNPPINHCLFGQDKCTNCETRYGLTPDGKCYNCEDKNCGECYTNYKICEKCKNLALDNDIESPTYGKCVGPRVENCNISISKDPTICSQCNDGYYLTLSGTCEKCDPNCKTCSISAFSCNSCVDLSYYISDGKCVKCEIDHCAICHYGYDCNECENGYAKYTNEDIIECRKIDVENCLLMDTFLYNCYKCKAGYGFDADKNCIKCQLDFCEDCNSNYQSCNKCIENYTFNSDKNICQPDSNCYDENCLKCLQVSYKKCHICREGYTEDRETCRVACTIENCNECYTNNKREFCDKCKDGYGKPTDASTLQCTKCKDPNCKNCDTRYPEDRNCIECYDGYAVSDRKCVICSAKNCDKCKPFYKCIQCKEGYAIDMMRGSNTYGDCILGGIKGCASGENGICTKCEDGSDPVGNDCPFSLSGNKNNKSKTTIIIIVIVCIVVVIIIVVIVVVVVIKKKKGKKDASTNESA